MNALNMHCEVYLESSRLVEDVCLYLWNYVINVRNREYNLLPYKVAVRCGCYSEGCWEKRRIKNDIMGFGKCFVFRGENRDDGIIRYMCEWRKLIQSALDWNGMFRTFDMDTWWKLWKRVEVRILFEVNEDNGKGFVPLLNERLERRK